MAAAPDDEALEINEEDSKKDREEAAQAKALNAVTDNVSASSHRGARYTLLVSRGGMGRGVGCVVSPNTAHVLIHTPCCCTTGAREAAR
jgi:hypothetical protein